MIDPGFLRFLFARAAEEHLAIGGTVPNKDIVVSLLHLGISFKYNAIPLINGEDVSAGSEYYEKYNKYLRDIHTDRGVINVLARETPCDCMNPAKVKAKSMEKLGYCWGCERTLPKERLYRCSGCNATQYCSRECQLKHWPAHKKTGCKHHPILQQGVSAQELACAQEAW